MLHLKIKVDRHIRRLDQDMKKFENDLEIYRKQNSFTKSNINGLNENLEGNLPNYTEETNLPFQFITPPTLEKQPEVSGVSRSRKYSFYS